MKTTLLLLVAAISALTSFGSVAGRSGDQIILQELQNKRATEESRRVAEEKRQMQEVLKRCAAMLERMEKSD